MLWMKWTQDYKTIVDVGGWMLVVLVVVVVVSWW